MAMDAPQPYDKNSADLLVWFKEEAVRRGFKPSWFVPSMLPTPSGSSLES
jgi:hypothetical protein